MQPPDWPIPENNGRFISQPHGESRALRASSSGSRAEPQESIRQGPNSRDNWRKITENCLTAALGVID